MDSCVQVIHVHFYGTRQLPVLRLFLELQNCHRSDQTDGFQLHVKKTTKTCEASNTNKSTKTLKSGELKVNDKYKSKRKLGVTPRVDNKVKINVISEVDGRVNVTTKESFRRGIIVQVIIQCSVRIQVN